jgi:hypothetical protein
VSLGGCVFTPLPDGDGDGACDGLDNCPYVHNPGQANNDASPAGDLCQCGDLDNDGMVEVDDVHIARKNLMGANLGVPSRCNVVGPSDGGSTDCGVDDIFLLSRFLQMPSTQLGDVCDAYGAP